MKIMGSPAPAASELTSLPEDVGHTSWSQRVRSLLLGPHGGGTTRRRASDAVRVGVAVVLLVICVPLVQANTSVEIHVTELITPPPSGLDWLITALWFLGSIGVIVTVVLVGLLVPRLTAVRQMGIAALAALAVCLLLDALLGSSGGRPPISDFAGFNPRFPVVQLAIAAAVALAGLPYLSRPMRRLVIGAVSIAALCAVVGAYGLPLGVIAALIVGWGTAAACHLAMGAPNGLPSAAEVTDAVRDLQVEVHGLTSMARQEWGVASFAGTDAEDRPLELAVYGRDAADAQWLRKMWRFCIYRDSGPTLVLNRLQQVEHEAYLTFLAGHAGALVPEIVAAGRCGPAHDAALITRLPDGTRFSQVEDDAVSDHDLDGFLRSVLLLRESGISHGALSPETVLITAQGPVLRDFRRASSSAPARRTDGDLAAAYRYTEARLTAIAMEMLGDIDKNTVDFAPNYDERMTEPTVFPSAFPNLLVNGGTGIAVGMATNMPPHNLGEIIDGTWTPPSVT